MCLTDHHENHCTGSKPPVSGYIYRKLPNGHFLVAFKDGNIDLNHWHLAPDGEVLSIVENGDHRFRRTDVRKNIREILPDLNLSFLYKG
jgi:hypothetical protein